MRFEGMVRQHGPVALLGALVAGFACLAVEVIGDNEVMVDEFAHLPAGISYLDLHRFYLYRVNPPLVQGIAALPVWLSGPKMDYSRAGSSLRSEWNVGLDFLRANVNLNRRYFSRARSVVTLLAVACGLLIYRWSSENHGRVAGLVGASLWFLDPNVLAHSTVVTTDVGASAFGLLAGYAFWRFLRDPTWPKAALAGVALGLAQGSKLSLLALYPSWLILAILARWLPAGDREPGQPPRRWPWSRLAGIFGISLLVLNLLYLFDGSFSALGSFGFRSRLLSGLPTKPAESTVLGNRFADTMLAGFPVPLPKDYVLGLDTQKWEGDIGSIDLRDGRLVRGGTWSSPLVTLSRKLPVGSLLLLGVSTIAALLNVRRARLADLMAWVPALVMLGFLCSERSINWAVRYALVLFPFLFVACGRIIQAGWRYRLARGFILACLAANVGELLITRPYYLSFGNQFVGGVSGAQRLFLGSNFDWGQDLLRLKRWHDENPKLGPIALSYYGVVDARALGLPIRGLTPSMHRSDDGGEVMAAPESGGDSYWAISSNVLNGLPGIVTLEDGSQFLGGAFSPLLRPEDAVARVGSTIYVFRIARPDEGAGTVPRGLRQDALRGCIMDEDQLASKVSNNKNMSNFTIP